MQLKVIKFAEETLKYIWNKNQKIYSWGYDNLQPQLYLDLYETVAEFQSSIIFILNNLINDGIEGYFDYYTLRKITFDYLLYGQFFIEVQKTRGGGQILTHLDAEKCRYNGDVSEVGYCADWEKAYKRDYVFKPITDSIKKDGIFVFKNPLSKTIYAKPIWFAALEAIKTAQNIGIFHRNTSQNSFITSKIINFKSGTPSPDQQEEYEREIAENFTGATAKRFMLVFSDGNPESGVEVINLEDDKLDEKFKSLQTWIREQIVIALSITSPSLIGIIPENQGFNSTEYQESYKIFLTTLISGLTKEMEYGLSILLGEEIKLGSKTEIATDVVNETTTVTDGQNQTTIQ